MVHGGGETDVAGVEALAGGKAQIALPEIEAGGADIAALGPGLLHQHMIFVSLGILLDDDRIGTLGQRRAGEDAHGLAGL